MWTSPGAACAEVVETVTVLVSVGGAAPPQAATRVTRSAIKGRILSSNVNPPVLRKYPLARSIRTTLAAEDGATRYGLQGETVTVHPDHVKRFDEINGAPEDTPAPKRRGRPPKA